MKYLFSLLLSCFSLLSWGQNDPLISIEQRFFQGGSTPVAVRVEGVEDLLGLQFALEWDPAAITFDSVGDYMLPELMDNSFGLEDVADGFLSFVWFDAALEGYNPEQDEKLFSVYFSPNVAVADTNVIQFSAEMTPPAIVYWDEGNIAELPPDTMSGALWLSQALAATVSAVTHVSCAGGNDGSVVINAGGGAGNYTFEMDDMQNTTGIFEGLPAGNYTVLITDGDGNEVSLQVTITEPSPLSVQANAGELPCVDLPVGSIETTVTGGTGAYEYLWSNGSTEAILQNVAAGQYSLVVTDSNDCSTEVDVELMNATFVDTLLTTSPTCAGGNDGSAELSLLNEDVLITWDDGTTDNTVSGLSAGVHEVEIIDGNGCLEIYTFALNDPPEINPNISLIYGCGDGNILASSNPQDGAEPYEITWSNMTTGNFAASLTAGTYGISVTDGNGCSVSSEFTVDYVAPLTFVAEIQDVTCANAQDGAIDLTVMGGLPPYTFAWSDGSTSEDITELVGGTYNVNVSAGSCSMFQSFDLFEAQPITATVSFVPTGDNLVQAEVMVIGGVPGYDIMWSNGVFGPIATDLVLGEEILLTITDANGCIYEEVIVPTITSDRDLITGANIVVFPNPNNGLMYLNWHGAVPTIEKISMVNALGQSVPLQYQQGSSLAVSINVPFSQAGFYWLCVDTPEEQFRIPVKIE